MGFRKGNEKSTQSEESWGGLRIDLVDSLTIVNGPTEPGTISGTCCIHRIYLGFPATNLESHQIDCGQNLERGKEWKLEVCGLKGSGAKSFVRTYAASHLCEPFASSYTAFSGFSFRYSR